MGAQGIASLDFGTFPGKSDATVVITGQTGIVAGSLVEAWIQPAATADHTADEHMLESLRVFARDIVAGTGFTIYGINAGEINEPDSEVAPLGRQIGRGKQDRQVYNRLGTRIYGTWNIAWVWN